MFAFLIFENLPSSLSGQNYIVHEIGEPVFNVGGIALYYDEYCVQLILFPGIMEEVLRKADLYCEKTGFFLPDSRSGSGTKTYSFSLAGTGRDLSFFTFERGQNSIGSQNANQEIIFPTAWTWDSSVFLYVFIIWDTSFLHFF